MESRSVAKTKGGALLRNEEQQPPAGKGKAHDMKQMERAKLERKIACFD
jgi:hypothetical protein